MAKEYCSPLDDQFGDFVQAAHIGLMEAAKRFNAEKGFTFITYAVWWIRQKCITESQDRVVRRPANHFSNKLRSKEAGLAQALGRFPTDDELFKELDVSESDGMNQKSLALPDSSMDFEYEDAAYTYADLVAPVMPTQQEDIEEDELGVRVREAIDNLDEREQTIVKLYHLHGLTLLDIGERLDITRERVRQIKEKAYRKMKVYLRNEIEITDFLNISEPEPEVEPVATYNDPVKASRRAVKRYLKARGFEENGQD